MFAVNGEYRDQHFFRGSTTMYLTIHRIIIVCTGGITGLRIMVIIGKHNIVISIRILGCFLRCHYCWLITGDAAKTSMTSDFSMRR